MISLKEKMLIYVSCFISVSSFNLIDYSQMFNVVVNEIVVEILVSLVSGTIMFVVIYFLYREIMLRTKFANLVDKREKILLLFLVYNIFSSIPYLDPNQPFTSVVTDGLVIIGVSAILTFFVYYTYATVKQIRSIS